MNSKKIFYSIVALCLILGTLMIVNRHTTDEVPFYPGETRQIWSVEAKVEFEASGEPVTISFAAPGSQAGFTLIEESTASLDYGLSYVENDHASRAIWTKRKAQGSQELYYKARFLVDPKADYSIIPKLPNTNFTSFPEPYNTAASQLVKQAHELSADAYSYTRELIKQLNSNDNAQNIGLLNSVKSKNQLIEALLKNAEVPARLVRGLYLEDGRRRQSTVDFVQVFKDENNWQLFNLEDGSQGKPENVLLWEYNGESMLDVDGAVNSRVTFAMILEEQSARAAIASKKSTQDLLNFSIDSLPLEEQALFKTILLIPIGVLIVVMLRVLVGLKTSGTFMPVLIAMAFVQTSLITGLIGFVLVVGVGLIIRSYLSHLNLLLVSRISAVIISVIAIITIFSVISFKIGLTEGLKITFFPMIILSWTIERMSVLWEEEGPKEVLQQGGGSLFVAVLAFAAMNNELVRHLTFNFIGLQLIVLAVILILGNYTGYRLLELRRFKPLASQED
ncbi:gonadoliberin III [Alginatibacterium sediminis]|uniref:Gonadoliberin III n=1 Tax=Alginatibacterium sediminis TaxID=2164068 RepID=A0A420EFZ5_9ALTE|nr:inactive transglutaminase family protein [Alginatibacterium sediminis]RKF19607.1 gonadoliberin III [Alginatibacterium sediminis]